jgi:hypothetical protein
VIFNTTVLEMELRGKPQVRRQAMGSLLTIVNHHKMLMESRFEGRNEAKGSLVSFHTSPDIWSDRQSIRARGLK